ncbi:MAG: hypothetical protein HYY01_03375 [Chloroflexi bacterium]|nr:hypothetical protein [Chloroflexota bacterium]
MAKVAALRPGPVRAAALNRAGGKDEAEVVLTREQVFEAVSRLPVEDKVKLKALLEAEFKKIDREFAKALRILGTEYRHIPAEEVERDVNELVSVVRSDRAEGRD